MENKTQSGGRRMMDVVAVARRPGAVASQTVQKYRKKKPEWRKVATKRGLIIAVAVVLACIAGYVFIKQNQSTSQANGKNGSVNSAQEEQLNIIKAVSQIVELPVDETPTIATVSDADRLKSQDFFRLAQNGDKVIIYSSSKRAILYRPSTNKVVEVASVNLGEESN